LGLLLLGFGALRRKKSKVKDQIDALCSTYNNSHEHIIAFHFNFMDLSCRDGGHSKGPDSTYAEADSVTWTDYLMAFQDIFSQRTILICTSIVSGVIDAI
jgi:hypothetical protein